MNTEDSSVPTLIVPTATRLWTRLLSFVLSLAVVLFAVAPALATSIQTDLWVYQNGDTVNVTGDGFAIRESVEVVTTDPSAVEVDRGTVTSDDAGNIAYSFVLNSDVAGIYDVVATGLISSLTAATQFDPNNFNISYGQTPDPVQYSDVTTLDGQVTCSHTGGGLPCPSDLSGSSVVVELNPGAGFVGIGTATTGAVGSWSTTWQATSLPGGPYPSKASASGGVVTGTPSQNDALTVQKEDTGVAYTGLPSGTELTSLALSATVSDTDLSKIFPDANLAGTAVVTFRLYDSANSVPVTPAVMASIDSTGATTGSPNLTLPSASGSPYVLRTTYAGNAYYLGSSDLDTITSIPSDTTVSQPTLLTPANGSATNDDTPAFDWTDVVDPSTPVTYAVQFVAKGVSCDFSAATTHGGVSGSTFTPSSSIGSDGTYCWRAKAIDGLGNDSGYTAAFEFVLDTVKPVITASAEANGSPYTAGTWTKYNVVVSFSCADEASGSGIATDTVAGSTVSSEGVTASVSNSGSCSDNAGNVANLASFGPIWIDKTAPVIVDEGPTTGPNGAGWYKTNVTNQFSVSDALSGINAACDAAFNEAGDWQSKTTSGEGTAVTVTSDGCTDVAGNPASGVSSDPFMIDLTNPTVAMTSPSDGSSTIAIAITVSGTVGDTPSGVASVTVNGIAMTVSGGTFSGLVPLVCGANVLTATATDNADRTATSSSITVTRTCFANLQFYSPIDQSIGTAVVNTGKYGRVIPVKVTFTLADGTVVTDAVMAANGWTLQIGVNGASCSGGPSDALEAYADAGASSAGSNLFRWSAGQWVYNLDTKAPPQMTMTIGQCYRLDVYLSDGTNKIKLSTGPSGPNPYVLFKPTK